MRRQAKGSVSVTWDQVRAWRLAGQCLTALAGADAGADADVLAVVRRLCGVQAQVASAAELAVATRQQDPRLGQVERALAERRLLRTWAMRGTLHALDATEAPAYLSMVAAARTWEKPAWQRAFLEASRLEALSTAAADALADRVLTREELAAEVVRRTGDAGLEEPMGSGWGAVLKPLAWQGLLCHGPAEAGRTTFTRPDTWLPGWHTPDPPAASRVVIPAYLRAYGPASPVAFDSWLTRGATKKATLRGWFADLGDDLREVDVEGEPLYARADDIEALAATRPVEVVRLLPAFDQHVLGPGTGDPHTVPTAHRAQVSRAAGWISPVVATGRGVAGVWRVADDRLEVTLFVAADPVDPELLEAEADRVGGLAGATGPLRVRRG